MPEPPVWARDEDAPRGPRPRSLDRAQIVAAAVEIADADGLERLSMRRVASRLGVGTMSLYRHVETKDDLLDLMVEQLRAPMRPASLAQPAAGERWRVALTEMMMGMRRSIKAHPWLLHLMIGRPPMGPNALRAYEWLLTAVDGLGLDMDRMVRVVNTVQAFVIGFVQAELAEAEAQRRTGMTEQQWRQSLRPYIQQVVDSGDYPRITRLVIEAEDYPDMDVMFAEELGYVLDGVAARIAAAHAQR